MAFAEDVLKQHKACGVVARAADSTQQVITSAHLVFAFRPGPGNLCASICQPS
jgi:hypothetical protein